MKNELRTAIDVRLSALRGTSESKKRIMRCVKEAQIVNRKLSCSTILAAALVVVLASVTLAAANGKNLIGWLYGENLPREMVGRVLMKPNATDENDMLALWHMCRHWRRSRSF